MKKVPNITVTLQTILDSFAIIPNPIEPLHSLSALITAGNIVEIGTQIFENQSEFLEWYENKRIEYLTLPLVLERLQKMADEWSSSNIRDDTGYNELVLRSKILGHETTIEPKGNSQTEYYLVRV